MKTDHSLNPYSARRFRGGSFSSVFEPDTFDAKACWRLKGSGVNGFPQEAPATAECLAICWDLGITIRERNMGSPANASSYEIRCDFLDGGLYAKTGNYFYERKGAWVFGPKAVLLLAEGMGVHVRRSWRVTFGLEHVTFSELIEGAKGSTASIANSERWGREVVRG